MSVSVTARPSCPRRVVLALQRVALYAYGVTRPASVPVQFGCGNPNFGTRLGLGRTDDLLVASCRRPSSMIAHGQPGLLDTIERFERS